MGRRRNGRETKNESKAFKWIKAAFLLAVMIPMLGIGCIVLFQTIVNSFNTEKIVHAWNEHLWEKAGLLIAFALTLPLMYTGRKRKPVLDMQKSSERE